MTAEMKTAEDVYKEYMNKLPPEYVLYIPKKELQRQSLTLEAMEAYAAQQVAEATKDCYPKEYLLWMGAECPYDYHESHKIWIHDMDRKTTDELFDYWKNLKK